MTFTELNEKLGGGENTADWRQVSGGGWLHKTAKVDDANAISGNAIVWGRVSGHALVFGDAQVSGNAWVFGDARVFGDAQVSGDAQVFGDAWDKSPLFIVGSKHSLTNSKKGHIQIGCHCHTYEYWKINAALIGATEGYSEVEIKEYLVYIDLFSRIGK